jgi:hypothetical protein
MGGAALILGYHLQRATEDADLLHDDDEMQILVDEGGFADAVAATNRELEEEGLYLTHIWGPEQQILTPEWREHCRPVYDNWGVPGLTVSVLGPADLILSKLCRADDEDLQDIRHIIRVENLSRAYLEQAMLRAVVPSDFADVFPGNCARVLALFG